jgi:hypothetical protein
MKTGRFHVTIEISFIHMKKIIMAFLISWLSGCLGSVYAQSLNSCKGWIIDYLDQMSIYTSPGKKQYYFLHLSVSTFPAKNSIYAQTAFSSENIEVKMILSAQQLFYESKYISIYQDATDVFTVLHPRKTIVWSKPEKATQAVNADAILQRISFQKKKLVENANVTQCNQTTLNGKTVQVIELVTDQKAKEEFYIDKIIYYYHLPSKQVVKQIIGFVEEYKFEKQEITFHQLDTHYQGKVAKSARENVFIKDKQLRVAYKEYHLE